MLNEVMDKFIELVRQGKIENLSVLNGVLTPNEGGDAEKQSHEDAFCAFLRRWLSGKGYRWYLSAIDLHVVLASTEDQYAQWFNDGSELDWHIQAAIWCCEREG